MKMRPVFRWEFLADLPERYARQYPDNRYDERWVKRGMKTAAEIRPALLALRPHERTKERIDAIMGMQTWTAHQCSECGGDFDVLIRFGDEPDYETSWQDLCGKCLSDGAALYAHYARLTENKNQTLASGDKNPAVKTTDEQS